MKVNKKKSKDNQNIKKNRKQLRKEGRKEKKAKKHDYYTNRKKPGQFVLKPPDDSENDIIDTNNKTPIKQKQVSLQPDQSIIGMQKEKKEQQKLQKQMNKQRNRQLLDANLEEDRNIKKLEKQLKLNKRKSKAVPKSFAEDGLDYLLEVCDSENMQSVVTAEQQLNEVNDEFEEDLALMTGDYLKSNKKKQKNILENESDDDFEDFLNGDDGSDDDLSINDEEDSENELSCESEEINNKKHKLSSNDSDSEFEEISLKKGNKSKKINNKLKKMSSNESDSEPEEISSKKANKAKKIVNKLKNISSDDSDSEPEEISSKKSNKAKQIVNKSSDDSGSEPEEINSKKPNKAKKIVNKLKKTCSDDSDSEPEEISSIKPNKAKKILNKLKNISSDDSGSEPEEISSKKSNKAKKIANKLKNISSDNSGSEPEEISSKKPNKAKKINKESSDDSGSEPEEVSSKKNQKRKKEINKVAKKQKLNESDRSDEEDSEMDAFEDALEDDEPEEEVNKNCAKKNLDGTWKDIYGRLRNKEGKIINKDEIVTQSKYIPPAVRARMENTLPEDKKRLEKLNRLKKQLKGLLNRLAESNMHNISTQIEELYMNNSRNDMNDTLTTLILEALISNVNTPDRLLVEHVVLITILHANIGTEVGAHFLQTVVKKFDEVFYENHAVENKTLDNLINIIAQLYNFKVFDSKLLYQILNRLSKKFDEKEVECILHVLKSVGFTLRKNDPVALKDLILDLQKQAAIANDDVKDNPRIRFMLDILLAIKNNNVNKIPNYDTTYAEHLKKIMKNFIRKGNYITQLNIGLDDLLKADERGKWWVVGSAWTGKLDDNEEAEDSKKNKSEGYSQKLLSLAKKQRMNTDTRRNIFCILMSAEDYLDAYEKILHLGLKNQQEREIINVILHCCLQEKQYNPYYGVLSQKFCDYDRKYQMTIKFSVWDKLKSLTEHSGPQIANLAKLLSHLFLEKGLPISTLKIVQFGELDKVTLRFMRQILLGILLTDDQEQCQGVFDKVAQSDKLKMFRESLRLFIHHFLLRNLSSESIPEDKKMLLEQRAKMVEKVLTVNDKKTRF